MNFHGMQIPPHMMEGLTDYVEHGAEPGSFLSAVISNDLKEAVARADGENIRIIPAYVNWLYNDAPSTCWGSKEKMNAWIRRHDEDREIAAQAAERQRQKDDADAAGDAEFDRRKDEGALR